jgi:hypothetical protein
MAVEDSTSEPSLEAELPAAPATETQQPYEVRELIVSYQKSAMLRLQGLWLDRAGLPIGTRVWVSVYPRRLEIEAVGEPLVAKIDRRRCRPLVDAGATWKPPRLDDWVPRVS